MYLLDTDWIIDYLKGKKDIVDKVNEMFEEGLAISVVSLAELYEGIYSSDDKEKHENDVCEKFGELRSELRKEGKLVDNFDLLIGSTAIVYDLIVATGNKEHFEKIKEIKLI